MRYVYFTKTLQKLDVPGLIAFCKDAGLAGLDMAVRPDFPVHPGNARTALPEAMKQLRDAGLTIGLVSTSTNLADPASAEAVTIFEAAAKAGVPAVKPGYFRYAGKFDADLAQARNRLAGFAKLAEKTGVRCVYHTHSGTYIGNNCASLRMLLADADPHHVGAFIDTGHLAVNGGPIRQELDMAKPWLAMVAIKDIVWEKGAKGWAHRVVPAGDGLVQWADVSKGLKACNFDGTISLHGEYETKDLAERVALARREREFLTKTLS
ncbi:MAG: sugar phosphate isomerase/epimerase family protein [Gemmataceae bacterium]